MSLITIMTAFCGGVFGALFGGTIAFIFSGFLAIIGAAIILSSGDAHFLNEIVFGCFFGPQISFVGGVAGAAWRGRETKNSAIGRDVMEPLYSSGSMLSYLIGGGFGVIGLLLSEFLLSFSPPIDAIALAIIIINLIIRLAVTDSPILTVKKTDDNWQDDLLKKICYHLPLAFFISFGSAYVIDIVGIATFGWGISALTLVFQFGTKCSIPVTHHVTLIAGYAVLAFNNVWIAATIGMLSMLVGLVFERVTNHKTASHIDMPAAMIAIFSFGIFIVESLLY